MGSADWPCADHMHFPKKKISLAILTKLSMWLGVQSVLSGDKMWTFEQKEEQRRQDETAFFHNAED
ncbi:unnamed protein product [Staurois parvus]|uniref:Uncharacterized protein n=1 Tax=Staurois parvus TaxID=386267 RepID=A0ABN9E981_9NEOB|nr:unnamed protein product [Staurois parvus]